MTEKWKEYYTEEQLRLLQKIEIDTLRVFIDVCKKMDLEYFVYGGTLLGTVKYAGMIPWDDDIDVALPRKSYEKFVKLAEEFLPEGYFLQSPYNCSRSPYPYTKLRKDGTVYMEYINRNLKIATGIYIDIYPVDKIPDEDKLRKKQFKKVRKWILIYVIRQSRLFDKKEKGLIGVAKNVIKRILHHLCKLLPQTYCIKKIDHYMTMYDDTNAKRYAALNSPEYNNIYLSLYPFEKGLFDGIFVNLPKGYRVHLAMRYGDYEKELPPEKRFGHIPYKLDFGNIEEGKNKDEYDIQ